MNILLTCYSVNFRIDSKAFCERCESYVFWAQILVCIDVC